jgi:hypothetical protein
MSKSLAEELSDADSWACCNWPRRAIIAEHDVARANERTEFYKSRVDIFQEWQRTLPEPYRTECCNILANCKIKP